MRVLFINPSFGYSTRTISNPMGIISLASYLNANGHDAAIYDRNCDKRSLEKAISDFRADVIGVSVLSLMSLADAREVTAQAKNMGYTVVWGGQIPSFYTDVCVKDSGADYMFLGEGELTWKEFLDRKEHGENADNIDGIAFYRDGKTVYTAEREFADLTLFPKPDWSLVKPSDYFQTYITASKMLMLPASKGCPCNCAFCGNRHYHRRTLRKGSIIKTVESIEDLVKNYGADGIYFTDELWYPDKRDIREFCALMKSRQLDVKWGLQARIGQFDEEILSVMKDAGCSWIFYGVESGSREMLKKINKQIDYDEIEHSIKITNDAGIVTMTSFIVGFPDETAEEIKDTVSLARRCGADIISFNMYFLTPGSDLYNRLIEQGREKLPESLDEIYRNFSTESTEYKNFSAVSTKELKVIQSYFHWIYFTGKNNKSGKMGDVAVKTAANTLKSIFSGFGHRSLSLALGAGKEFASVLYYALCFPKILKKYGLK